MSKMGVAPSTEKCEKRIVSTELLQQDCERTHQPSFCIRAGGPKDEPLFIKLVWLNVRNV